MVRWLMFGLLALGVAIVFVGNTPGLLAIGFVAGFVGLIGFVFALAAERVSATARPESMMVSPEELALLKKRQSAASTPRTVDAGRAPPEP
ncbi:MAG TPA: hypothetical protein VGC30_00745 [Dokdonella sp.]